MDGNIKLALLFIFYKFNFFQTKGDLHAHGVTDFIEESLLMRKFKHPNVLHLIGISVRNGTPCAILPLMSNGDLKSYMKQHGSVCTCIQIPKFQFFLRQIHRHDAFLPFWNPLKSSGTLIDTLKDLATGQLYAFAVGIARGMDHLAERKFVHRDLAARNCL